MLSFQALQVYKSISRQNIDESIQDKRDSQFSNDLKRDEEEYYSDYESDSKTKWFLMLNVIML